MNRYATEHSDFETVDDLNKMNRRRHRSKIQNIKNNDAHNIDYESNSTKKSCNTNDTAPEDIANRDVANTFHHSSDCLQHSESIQDIPNLVDFASGGKENTITSDEDEFIVDPLSIPPVLGRDFTLEGDDHLCPKLPTLHELNSVSFPVARSEDKRIDLGVLTKHLIPREKLIDNSFFGNTYCNRQQDFQQLFNSVLDDFQRKSN